MYIFHLISTGGKFLWVPGGEYTIQSNLVSTIAMAFDECIENPVKRTMQEIRHRELRDFERCVAEMKRLNGLERTINKKPAFRH